MLIARRSPVRRLMPGQQAAVAAGVEDVDVARVGRDVAALAAADLVELTAAGARHAGGRVVLLRAAHVIRHVGGREDVVELRGRKVLIGPALTGVGRHVGAAVVAVDHPCRIRRGDPQVVVVAVRDSDRRQRLAGVGRAVDPRVEHVDRVARLRVGVDPRVIERPLPEPAIVVDAGPGRAGVVRQEHAALGGFDDGVDAAAVGARDRHAHLAPERRRQALVLRQLGPRLAAVGRLEEPAAGTAARQRMRRAEDLPEAGVEHVGVLRIHRQIDRPGLVVAEEHAVPRLAAVGRLEDRRVPRSGRRDCRAPRRRRRRDWPDGRVSG